MSGGEMNQANFADTSMKGLDLSSSSFNNIIVSFDQLKGCVTSLEQAMGFARALG
ncbi:MULTISPECIES: hypothetical protein [Bacillaceae]|nr:MULTISPECIES: hypothetical protein [Bacillaceae]